MRIKVNHTSGVGYRGSITNADTGEELKNISYISIVIDSRSVVKAFVTMEPCDKYDISDIDEVVFENVAAYDVTTAHTIITTNNVEHAKLQIEHAKNKEEWLKSQESLTDGN